MLWAALTVSILAGVILSGTVNLRTLDGMAATEFAASGHAHEVARAGLADAYAWFRRQPQQPVESFAPRLEPAAVPPVEETEDPEAGIVRSWEISPGLWGRYTVPIHRPAERFNDSVRNGRYDLGEAFTDTDKNGRWDPDRGTREIAAERGLPGTGALWLLESEGLVYVRPDEHLPLGEGRNHVIARTRLSAEIRRLTISPPASAALVAEDPDDVIIGDRGRVRAEGDGTAIAHRGRGRALGLTGQRGRGQVRGRISAIPNDEYKTSVEDVFGMDWDELRGLADRVVTNVEEQIDGDLPPYQLTFFDGDARFREGVPLRGRGIIVVRGDLVLEQSSNSFFSGVVFVEGDLTMRGPAYIRGMAIVRGQVNVLGSGGDYADIDHDPQMIDELLQQMGRYRFTKAPFQPAPRALDGRPIEGRVLPRS